MQIYVPYLGLLLFLWPSSFMDTGLSGLLPWRKLYLGVCRMCFLWGPFFLGCSCCFDLEGYCELLIAFSAVTWSISLGFRCYPTFNEVVSCELQLGGDHAPYQ